MGNLLAGQWFEAIKQRGGFGATMRLDKPND